MKTKQWPGTTIKALPVIIINILLDISPGTNLGPMGVLCSRNCGVSLVIAHPARKQREGEDVTIIIQGGVNYIITTTNYYTKK